MTYKRITVVLDKEIEFLTCESCGVLIFDTENHDRWHENYASVASSARNAYMMTKPIGPGLQLDQAFIDKQVEDFLGGKNVRKNNS